jgi:hypothetical protein
MPGRTMHRPPSPPTPGSPLPFFHEPTGCAGHDLLVLNPRPDLSPDHAALSNRHAWQALFAKGSVAASSRTSPATAFLQSCFSRKQP